jgi:hypothetical protein
MIHSPIERACSSSVSSRSCCRRCSASPFALDAIAALLVHLALERHPRHVASEASVEMVEQPHVVGRTLLMRRGRVGVGRPPLGVAISVRGSVLFECRVGGDRCGDVGAQLHVGLGEKLHALDHLWRHTHVNLGRDPVVNLEPHRILPVHERPLGVPLMTS